MVRIFQRGNQCFCCVNRCQNIDAGLDGMSSDNKSVMAVLNALGRCVDNQVNLMTKNQIQNIRRLLLYLSGQTNLYIASISARAVPLVA